MPNLWSVELELIFILFPNFNAQWNSPLDVIVPLSGKAGSFATWKVGSQLVLTGGGRWKTTSSKQEESHGEQTPPNYSRWAEQQLQSEREFSELGKLFIWEENFANKEQLMEGVPEVTPGAL